FHSTVDQPLGFSARAVVPGHRVTLVEQPVHHLAAHHAESDESKIRHLHQPPDYDAGFKTALSCPLEETCESSRTCCRCACIASRALSELRLSMAARIRL